MSTLKEIISGTGEISTNRDELKSKQEMEE